MVETLSLRAVGSTTGHRIKRPSSWASLLEIASSLLLNHSNHSAARYVFDRQGDQISTLDLVKDGEVLYVSDSAVWRPAPAISSALGRPLRKRDRLLSVASGAVPSTSADASFPAAAASTTSSAAEPAFRPQLSALAHLLLPPDLVRAPLLITAEEPQRLCAHNGVPSKPPWGLAGDHSQLGSNANFTKLRGDARKEAFLQLCERFARRLQQRAKTSLAERWLPSPIPFGASCAVVGSGGSLARSGSGAAIDAHDVVMRFNLAPAGGALGMHVGERTTLRILTDKSYQGFLRGGAAQIVNRSVLAGGGVGVGGGGGGGGSGGGGSGGGRGARGRGQAKAVGGRTSEPAATLLLYCMAQGWVGKCMHEQRLDHVNPVFVRGLRAHLDEHQGRSRLPSAGLLGMAMALTSCSRVSLFGFGNASDTRNSSSDECGHYWECSRQQSRYFAGKSGYHDWHAQWRLVSAWLARAGADTRLASALVFHSPP
jgi:hypothetical protein